MLPDDPRSLRYDHALAAGLLILKAFDPSSDAPQPRLLSQVTYIVLDALVRYEAESRPRLYRESVN